MSGAGITYLWPNKEFPPFIRLEGRRGDYEVYTLERTCKNDSIKRNCGVFACSECCAYLDIADMTWDGEDDSGGFYEPRFCPNCGAKVVEQ